MKQAIYKISGQDATGFLGLEEVVNTIGLEFGFERQGVGFFNIANFDPTKHALRAVINQTAYHCNWSSDDNYLMTNFIVESIVPADDCFAFGGFIFIDEVVEEEYTPQELSEIYHACSILTRGGNPKLVELASKIGFPKPH